MNAHFSLLLKKIEVFKETLDNNRDINKESRAEVWVRTINHYLIEILVNIIYNRWISRANLCRFLEGKRLL